jgi:hypothetical protein
MGYHKGGRDVVSRPCCYAIRDSPIMENDGRSSQSIDAPSTHRATRKIADRRMWQQRVLDQADSQRGEVHPCTPQGPKGRLEQLPLVEVGQHCRVYAQADCAFGDLKRAQVQTDSASRLAFPPPMRTLVRMRGRRRLDVPSPSNPDTSRCAGNNLPPPCLSWAPPRGFPVRSHLRLNLRR